MAHGAAFPAEAALSGSRSSGVGAGSGVSSAFPPTRPSSSCSLGGFQHQQWCLQRGASAPVPCCCCSDHSTHSGASGEQLCRGRWCGASCTTGSGALLQQQQRAVGVVLNVPTLIESRGVKCLILDAPTNENLQAYLEQMAQVGVTDLVRTCPPTYDDAPVLKAGIRMHDLTFPDGEAPPIEVICRWRTLASRARAEGGVIAVHCVAGLGRGPVLVAVSLIDSGLDADEAVNFIRSRRKGAINRRQLAFLHSYRRHAVASRRCMRRCALM
ncbi:putative phosphatase [Cyclospora cayetanensis]|uniref:Protein tyrosine phosphatase type IVA 3 n=1 Tax=Cyclospora cayetanensis TaxID=88456 RepID=A0A1D3D8H0_9EIME|nr:putative phosphatase [Cyclospora cayetanensis]